MESIYLDVSDLFFSFIVLLTANSEAVQLPRTVFSSLMPLITNLFGTAAKRKISEAESARTDSVKSQPRANFRRIIIDEAEFMMVRSSEILFISAVLIL